jgi:hypothetical protein
MASLLAIDLHKLFEIALIIDQSRSKWRGQAQQVAAAPLHNKSRHLLQYRIVHFAIRVNKHLAIAAVACELVVLVLHRVYVATASV